MVSSRAIVYEANSTPPTCCAVMRCDSSPSRLSGPLLDCDTSTLRDSQEAELGRMGCSGETSLFLLTNASHFVISFWSALREKPRMSNATCEHDPHTIQPRRDSRKQSGAVLLVAGQTFVQNQRYETVSIYNVLRKTS